MSRWPNLSCAEVKRALKALGFSPAKRAGTSHEQWIKRDGQQFHKVTVDCPKEPFTLDLADSMAKQAGITRRELYRAADKKRKWHWIW